jgi:hypothetical protein
MTFKVGDIVQANVNAPVNASSVDEGDHVEVTWVDEETTFDGKEFTRFGYTTANGAHYIGWDYLFSPVTEYVSPRAALLREAESLITGDRNNQYGPPTQDFARTAEFWTTYLGDKLKDDTKIEAHDIAAMMTLLKLSRITWSPEKQDSWADAAGYIGCGWECVVDEQKSANGN